MERRSHKIVFEGVWLGIQETVYKTRRGEEIVWESVIRKNTSVGMVVVACLRPSNRFVFIKQYRPALDGYMIGFPAGLADDDVQHALVELKEETGYTGEIKSVSPVLKSNSGIINDSGRVICVDVDEHHPLNLHPEQELEPCEDIEVILLRKDEVKDYLLMEYEKGTHIGSNAWYLFVLADAIRSVT